MGNKKNNSFERPVLIPVRTVSIDYVNGIIAVPLNPKAFVIFVRANRASRQKFIHNWVASVLRRQGWGTLLLDLLSPEEERSNNGKSLQFDLLTQRLNCVTDWALEQQDVGSIPIGYFAMSMAAATTLRSAAVLSSRIRAIVSAGGRPDLACGLLGTVLAPTLLIVGGRDQLALELNKEAFDEIKVEKQLIVIPEATHLFKEPGALTRVEHLATDWFKLHLEPSILVTAITG